MPMLSVIPALPVRDIDAATDFYRERFGFSVAHKQHDFAIVKRDAAEIHLWATSDEGWKVRQNLGDAPVRSGAESFLAGTASCRIEVQGIDDLYTEFRASGVLYNGTTKVVTEPWGVRDLATLDLERNLLTFYEVIRPAR